MNAAELKRLQDQFPEGIPQWMAGRTYDEVVGLMELRRKAFPKTKKEK